MAKKKAPAAAPTFEAALERLEKIVLELEQPELPLERSLAVFEEGVGLSRLLHQQLDEAERRVEVLLKDEQGRKVPVPFAGPPDAAESDDADDADDADDDAGGEDDDEAAGGGGQRALPF